MSWGERTKRDAVAFLYNQILQFEMDWIYLIANLSYIFYHEVISEIRTYWRVDQKGNLGVNAST